MFKSTGLALQDTGSSAVKESVCLAVPNGQRVLPELI